MNILFFKTLKTPKKDVNKKELLIKNRPKTPGKKDVEKLKLTEKTPATIKDKIDTIGRNKTPANTVLTTPEKTANLEKSNTIGRNKTPSKTVLTTPEKIPNLEKSNPIGRNKIPAKTTLTTPRKTANLEKSNSVKKIEPKPAEKDKMSETVKLKSSNSSK